MKSHKNRYAWINSGPLTIIDGREITPGQLRKLLAKRGIVVNRWARNWSEFLGWVGDSTVTLADLIE